MSTWIVKYDGPCSGCGTTLLAGTPAVWDRRTRSMHCIECPAQDVVPEPPAIDEGVAGASSRRQHERRVAKHEARIEMQYGHGLIGKMVRAVSSEPQSTRAWAIGAAGEEKLAAELATVPGIRMLHDRSVPGTPANIDHIVIAPAGVFVVDAKHLKGRIEIRNKGWLLRADYRLYVGGHDQSRLARDMGWQVEAVRVVIAGAGVDPQPPVIPVLCFVDGDWPLISPPDVFEGVRLESERSIRKRLTRSAALPPSEIDRLATILARALPPK